MNFRDFQKLFITKIIIYYVFIVSGLIINLLELLTFIFIWPFNKLLYRKIIYYLAYSLYSTLFTNTINITLLNKVITVIPQWWCNSPLKVYANEEDCKYLGKENCYCVFNHRYDIDWALGWVFAQMTGQLGGAKVILKSPLKYIPILGWSWSFSEYIFVRREWEADRKIMTRDLSTIFDFPEGFNYSVTIFCEGTRFTPEKHAESMKVAKDKGLPELKYHLLPRTKGFFLAASLIEGKTIKDINGHSPRFSDMVNGEKIEAELYIRRMPLSDCSPQDEKSCSEFVHKLYREKDDIFGVYQRTGSYANIPGVRELNCKRNGIDLYNAIGWVICVLVPSTYYLIHALFTGSWTFKIVLALCIISMNFLVKWMMAKTDVRKGSKFGLTNSNGSKKTS